MVTEVNKKEFLQEVLCRVLSMDVALKSVEYFEGSGCSHLFANFTYNGQKYKVRFEEVE